MLSFFQERREKKQVATLDEEHRAALEFFERKLADTPIERDPFPYWRIEGVFPEDFYTRVLENLPPISLYKPIEHIDAKTQEGHVTRHDFWLNRDNLARLPDGSADFWWAFKCWITARPTLRQLFQPFEETILPRHHEARKIVARMGLIQDTKGYRIRPHPDAEFKVLSLLFYLPEDDSLRKHGTTLHRVRKSNGELEFEDAGHSDFTPNTMFAFPRSDISYHSVREIENDIRRNSIHVNITVSGRYSWLKHYR